MNEPADPVGAAKEQAAREIVGLIGSLLFIGLAIWMQRKAHEPDAGRTLKMRTAKALERYCARSAANYWQWAERFRKAYEDETPP